MTPIIPYRRRNTQFGDWIIDLKRATEQQGPDLDEHQEFGERPTAFDAAPELYEFAASHGRTGDSSQPHD